MEYRPEMYGAIADGINYDTKAIQKAVDVCYESGGGKVILGKGIYLSGSLILKSNVELYVEKGSILKASSNLEDYYKPNSGLKDGEGVGTPVTLKPSYAFIYAKDSDFLTISGGGIIDGNCYAFVERVDEDFVTGNFYPRPTLIYIEHSNHISITNITLRNSPFWTLHPAGCNDVQISNIRILNPIDVANSDGIDPDHSSNVRITGCHVECADDAICLKATAGNMEYQDTENIIISECTLRSSSAALKIGTEGAGSFRNIMVHDCIVYSSNRGISIQIRDSGNVKDISFRNINIETKRFSKHWWGSAEPIAITSFNRNENTVSGNISNVVFENINCNSENGILVACDKIGKIDNIKFNKIKLKISSKTNKKKGVYDLRPGINTGIIEDKIQNFMVKNAVRIQKSECEMLQ